MPVTHFPHAQTAGRWIQVGVCPRCKAPAFETRQGTDHGRQEEHRAWCRALQKEERKKGYA